MPGGFRENTGKKKKNRKSGMENEMEGISGMVGVMRKWATTEDEEQKERENK